MQAVLKSIEQPRHSDVTILHSLLQTMALVDEQLDAHAIGSFKSRRNVQKARQLVLAQVNVVLFLQNHPALNASKACQQQLQQWIVAFEAQQPAVLTHAAIQMEHPELQNLLQHLRHAYQQYFYPNASTTHNALPEMHLHRNWMGAIHTFVRSFSVLTAAGLLWWATGWDFMPFMMLGLSVMLSVFVGFENPAWFLRHVAIGQVIGASLALLCIWTAWQYGAHSEWQMIFWMLPFMLLHILLYAFKPSMLGAFDVIMVMLILLQPHYPLHIGMAESFANAVSVVTGPVIALLAFTWIFPAHPHKRLQHLLSMVRLQLRSLCSSKAAYKPLTQQRNRLVHSVLKAQRINDKLPQPDPHLSLALLQTLQKAEIILCIHRTMADTPSNSTQRLMRALLQSWQKPQTKPE